MSARPNPREALGLGYHPQLDPDEIAAAPELAILAAVDAALDTAIAAVIAAHPTLVGPDPFDEVPAPGAPPLYLASVIVAQAHALRVALDLYRCAVRCAAGEDDEPRF